MKQEGSHAGMASSFAGRTVLITGGTGSFGHEFVRFLLPLGCREIRVFSRDELKQEEMRIALADATVKFYIGDVRDRTSVDAAMRDVNYVFHAAALKQVPSCEFFPMQAVATNVIGSQHVVESAIAHGVSRLVCLSTDKAVYPINAMGMTKALMEKVTQAAARGLADTGTALTIVRYGNVMYSRGSVIPLFVRQIRAGLPLTITVPEMTRFLLPLPMAIELVAFAFREGRQGDLFIRKAKASTVGDLAQALKNLFRSNVPTNAIGIRHGEKLFETLATREERAKSEDMGEYYRIRMDDRDLNYGKFFTDGEPWSTGAEDYTSHNTERLDIAGLEALLRSMPEIQAELRAAGCL